MPDSAQPRSSVTILSTLLLLQAAGLVGAVVYTLRSSPPKTATGGGTSFLVQHPLAIAFILLPPLVLTLVALGCTLFRRGWLPAMLTQLLALATCLWLYFDWRPIAIYPLMLYGVVMVLYLNSRTFRTVARSPGQGV